MNRSVNTHNRNGYKRGCRCEVCRAAHAEYQWESRILREDRQLAADDPRHGNVNTYINWRCRCEACTAANTAAWESRQRP